MLRHPFPALLLAIALLGTSLGAGAAVYRWTDASGNVHFSQEVPPQGTDAKELRVRPAPLIGDTPPPKSPAKAAGDVPAAKAGTPSPAESAQQKVMREKNCAIARNNLRVFQRGGRIRDAKWNIIGLTDKQRQARIAETEKLIKKFCK